MSTSEVVVLITFAIVAASLLCATAVALGVRRVRRDRARRGVPTDGA